MISLQKQVGPTGEARNGRGSRVGEQGGLRPCSARKASIHICKPGKLSGSHAPGREVSPGDKDMMETAGEKLALHTSLRH